MKFNSLVNKALTEDLKNVKISRVTDEDRKKIDKIFESILDPVNKKLSSDIFDENKVLKPEVKKAILNRMYIWWLKLGFEKEEIKNVIMIGSITGYQYADSSDIDVNIGVDLTDEEVSKYAKILPNGNLLGDTKHPINYYLANNLKNVKQADSAYDVLKDEWIKKANKENASIPYSYGFEIAKFFMDGFDNRILEYKRDKHELDIYKNYLNNEELEMNKEEIEKRISLKEEEVKADLDAIHIGHKLLSSFRHEAFDDGYEPDFLIKIETSQANRSINNIVYKIIEQFGYLEKLTKYEDIRKSLETGE